VSLTLILTVTAAVAASMGYLAARRQGDAAPESDRNPGAKGKGGPGDDEEDGDREGGAGRAGKRKPRPPVRATSAFEDLPLALGDVVTAEREERWLAGALVAREQGRVVGVLFVAPEGAVQKAVAVFSPPRRDVYWMDPRDLEVPGEPPSTVEIGGIALRRRGRLPVTLERVGQGTPDLGEEGLWAVYEGGGRDVAVMIAGRGRTCVWSGARLDEHEYDRLGAGGD
jgi:hypothetical protein